MCFSGVSDLLVHLSLVVKRNLCGSNGDASLKLTASSGAAGRKRTTRREGTLRPTAAESTSSPFATSFSFGFPGHSSFSPFCKQPQTVPQALGPSGDLSS